MNRVVLIGRLTRDPELRTTSTGKNVVSFSIAVNKRFKPQDGSPDADFFRCTAWGSTADFVSNYLHKGRLIAVDGRIEQRSWTDKEGGKRETVEVVAENVQGLDRAKDDAGGGGGQGAYNAGGSGGYASSGSGSGGGAPVSNSVPSADEYDPFADD
jgi:single-strand DNA-binding protein